MPELPEVETVRRGLSGAVPGRVIDELVVLHPRTSRRQQRDGPGPADLAGRVFAAPRRRGKFLWLPVEDGPAALCAHLGMSGQLRMASGPRQEWRGHERAVVRFDDDGPDLWFIDQRTFGWLSVEAFVGEGDAAVPVSVAPIARDVLDPSFDEQGWSRALRRRHTTVKRALLDQRLQSGVGNIYSDEALWRVALHPDRPTHRLSSGTASALLESLREVMRAALTAGGTSTDALFVNVNGDSGRYGQRLSVYGREGLPCPRCRSPIARVPFANRSSHYCPSCQRPPRYRRRS